jgi:hypothetical protein
VKAAMSLSFIMGGFLICWLPFFIWMPLVHLMVRKMTTEATSLKWKSQCLENPSVPLLRLADKKSRIQYIEFETLKKQCWPYLRNIKTAKNYFFYIRFAQNLAKFLLSKNLAEHWDLPNTGIFYSKDVASVCSLQRTVPKLGL